jgi:hypothetical protein
MAGQCSPAPDGWELSSDGLQTNPHRHHISSMTNLQKTYTRPQPLTKNQLREMLAQAVRNTQPDAVTIQAPKPKISRRTRPHLPR